MAKSKAKKQRSFSFILLVIIVAFAVYFAVSLVSSAKEIQSKQAEVDSLQAQCNEQLAENEELQEVINSGDKDEYIQKVAREKYGYIMPGDRVYQDIASGE
ncbi:MAG: septum formation initiator family protein [Clostridia bacterium]|nr:septum formation initiator family protein [Clostridia bacterium]